MILPFTTYQWNAIRFVAINLISVPLIELALHKLHQLGVANRMLRGRKARVRPSFLANWGLHQEVDELSVRSRITAFIVAFCYVGFSLYTEYASDSTKVQKKYVWEPPAMERSSLHDKAALFDTTVMPVGRFPGCRSKKSIEKLQQLLKHTVNVKVRMIAQINRTKIDPAIASAVFRRSAGVGYVHFRPNHSLGNSNYLAFSLHQNLGGSRLVAEMHDEEVRFQWGNSRLFARFSNSENTTLSMVAGNILLFDGILPRDVLNRDYLTLLSASAFDFRCEPTERIGKSTCDAFAIAHTPSEFSNALSKLRQSSNATFPTFYVNFKYDLGPTDNICYKTHRIELPSVKVPEKAKLSLFSDPWTGNGHFSRRYWHARRNLSPTQVRRTSFGLFRRKIIFFEELKLPRFHCSSEWRQGQSVQFCAQRHSNGTISLSSFLLIRSKVFKRWNSSAVRILYSRVWTLEWTGQDLNLSDLSRGALAYSIAGREYHGPPGPSAHSISDALKRGIPKLTQVGSPGVKYDVIVGDPVERATMYAWVLGVWATMLLVAVNYLLFVKLSKARLFPDVYLLYCHSVMRKHTRYNSGKSVRTAPTAAMASVEGIVNLHISYDDLSKGNIKVDDMLQ